MKRNGSIDSINGVYIQQIGDFNSANINIKANRTEIKLNQQGYGNSIAISKKLFRYNKRIIQKSIITPF
jgi:hypothetical protein